MNDDGADVVEQGGGRRFFPSLNWLSLNWRPMNWRPPRGAAILLAVGLAVGLAAGYALGYRQVRNVSPAPSGSSASASLNPASPNPAPAPILVTLVPVQDPGAVILSGLALTQDTGTCSVQSGRELQLGVQVTNGSTVPIGLGQIHTAFPLGGLRVISQQWAPCGAIGGANGAAQVPVSLGPGDSTWLSVTVQVLVACPGPLPVQFTVDYTSPGGHGAAKLAGFPDLGEVPYTGCHGS